MENDPLEGLNLEQFDPIDEEDLQQLDAEIDSLNMPTEPILEEEPVPQAQSADQVQPQQEASTEATEQTEEKEGNAIQTTAEAALAIPTGVVDWGIGLYNTVMPGEIIDLPHIPRFQNEATQVIRDISSVVVPNFASLPRVV